jgi:hypothetical protein
MRIGFSIALLMITLAGAASAAELRLHAVLDGASVISATDSKGTGEATASLTDDNKLRINLVFGGLTSSVTGAELHLGNRSENGAAVAPLDVRTNQRGGSLVNADVTLTPDAAASVRDGDSYLLVTTNDRPAGEIRGQLLPQPVRLPDMATPPTTP